MYLYVTYPQAFNWPKYIQAWIPTEKEKKERKKEVITVTID